MRAYAFQPISSKLLRSLKPFRPVAQMPVYVRLISAVDYVMAAGAAPLPPSVLFFTVFADFLVFFPPFGWCLYSCFSLLLAGPREGGVHAPKAERAVPVHGTTGLSVVRGVAGIRARSAPHPGGPPGFVTGDRRGHRAYHLRRPRGRHGAIRAPGRSRSARR